MAFFRALTAPEAADILKKIEIYHTTLSAISELDSFDHGQILWRTLRSLGYRVFSDFFAHIQRDDIIEIYDSSGFQIWRSFNFFKICSYTLEEIYCVSWLQRYHRDEEFTRICAEAMMKTADFTESHIFDGEIPPHEVREIASQDCLILEASHRWIGRLVAENSCDSPAVIVASACKVKGRDYRVGTTITQREQNPSLSN